MAAYGLLKAISQSGLDIDSAEQVYFAQSWQMGYGTRQPPLYTWLLLALKPQWATWEAALELARYFCIGLWFAGVQAVARACGASREVQAKVLLIHMGALLAMWRVHDSLTHTVLAGAVAVWACAMLIQALRAPAYWPAVGVLAALACLSKLNAALWCASAFLSACVVLVIGVRSGRGGAASLVRHVGWMFVALLVFVAVMFPYGHWWLAHANGLVALARRIVVSDEQISVFQPLLEVTLGTLEYLLIGPLLVALLAWRWRKQSAHERSLGEVWLLLQMVLGLGLLALVLTLMKASHFTPRWLWPVVPGATVWMTMRGVQILDQVPVGGWQKVNRAVMWAMPVLALCMVPLRAMEPSHNAQRCRNCWTDRPAEDLSAALHDLYGQQPLRFVTGDDHLAGVLVQVRGDDRAWTAISPDLPPPEGFARTKAPCVAVWIDVDRTDQAPAGLKALVGPMSGLVHAKAFSLRLAPQRSFWMQSSLVPDEVCAKSVW